MTYQDQLSAIGKAADDELAAAHAEVSRLQSQVADLERQLAGYAPKSKLGIYISGGLTGVHTFETWLGKKVDLVHQYSSPTGNPPGGWSEYVDQMVISLDMLGGSTSFPDVIAGKHDAAYTAYGTKLVQAGMANAIIRLGWEYNGGWMAWAMAKAGSAANWKAAFRRVVAALRKAPGQKFTFEWNLAQGKTWDAASYPGDDVVDICGADTYAGYTSGGVVYYNTPQSRTDWFNGKPAAGGKPAIPSWLDFVKSHGKPTAVSEWGAWEKDDAAYCTEMLDRFKAWGNLAYHIPFNVKGHDGIEHRFPTPYSAFGAAFKTRGGLP